MPPLGSCCAPDDLNAPERIHELIGLGFDQVVADELAQLRDAAPFGLHRVPDLVPQHIGRSACAQPRQDLDSMRARLAAVVTLWTRAR